MAGKFGIAAKILLGTTVLAGGGAGTWYAITNGVPSMAELSPVGAGVEAGGDTNVDGETAATNGTDLDAVASAWAEPEARHPVAATDSSPVARSAAITTGHGGAPVTADSADPAPAGGRYALTEAPTQTEQATSAIAEPKSTDAASIEPTPAEASPAVADGVDSREPPESETEAVAIDAPNVVGRSDMTAADGPELSNGTATPALARGQEPSDETNLKSLKSDSTSVPTESSTAESDAQARQAFENSPSAAAGGRYGAAVHNKAAPTEGGKSGLVNPFAAGAGPSNQPASADQNLQPLPADNAPAELAEPQLTNELRPLRPLAPSASAPEPAPIGGVGNTGSLASQRGALGQSDIDRSLADSNQRQIASQSPSAGSESADTPGEKALEGPQRPSLEIQKFAPAEIQVGKPAKFVVRVRNIGNQTAQDVSIQDAVPQGTKLVSTTPEAQSAGGRLVWALGKLSPGEDRTVEMLLMPTAEGEVGSVAAVNYSSHASVKTKCTMSQLAIRMTAPAKVMVGQEQRVKIELRNPGSGDATGVMLFENVPQNVKHAAGPALEFDIGTLKAGETRELELVLLAEKPGKTVNVLSARADGNLQVQQQVEFEVIAPGLSVDVEGPERRYLERPATYEVRVDNPGTAPAHDVRIVTKLPKGMRFIKANNKGEYDAASHAVYWSLAELPEGEHGVVELVAMPVEAGPQTLEVESRAGQGLSDQTQRQIMIDGLAAIMFEVKDLEDPIEVGGETGYEIRVVNQGTKAATNVQVAVNLPAGMKLVSAEGETQHTEQRGAIVFEPLGQLAAKADTVYRIRVQGTAAGDQRVTVQVNTDDLGQPIRREESTLVYGDE